MTLTISKSHIVIPPKVQREAGFKLGDQIEVRAVRGVITIAVKPQTADDEYTPEQRRIVDAQLAEGLADVQAGRIHSFASAKEASAFIEASVVKKKTTNRKVR
jgi:bifunctional DNA-binding transcriptional regulator/antitoxin component of YhaV-PrlF toxin-antitoxin module